MYIPCNKNPKIMNEYIESRVLFDSNKRRMELLISAL